jgi:hypothetical protein
MKRMTLRTENQWRSLKDGAGVDLLRVSFVRNGFQVGVGVTVAGFGLGLTYWKRAFGLPITYTDEAGRVWTAHCSATYAWEPIETHGWAGEPQGMEKAP